ncbi:MAG: valine--tRNA ligase [Anaerolineales bacterium]
MPLPKKYMPGIEEPNLYTLWEVNGIYSFAPGDDRPIFSIDTPPPTVSGKLHLGHIYSYTSTDIFARFHRMRGENVLYPMGFDDNGLPTERLVEKQLGIRASEIDLHEFVKKCQEVSIQAEKEYQEVWQRLGLSIDWTHTYRTIDHCSRLTSQRSFIDLYKAGLVYRQEAPTIWCSECGTAISQADVNDLERASELVTLAFSRPNGELLPVATTRPELLPACVSIFVHPEDSRFTDLIGEEVQVPLFGHRVMVRADTAANPQLGTGAVMCCTFGDSVDKYWWYTHRLDHIQAIDRQGRLTEVAGEFSGIPVDLGRHSIIARLAQEGLILESQPTSQVVPVHERCDTPVEFLMSQQWFIRLLEYKSELLAAAERINWHPKHMKHRYISWVENLAWDWCISRQRYYGIHFPLWYCQSCGGVVLADEGQLPVDPNIDQPTQACHYGGRDFLPEKDILETWATSSLTPQIVGRWSCPDQQLAQPLFDRVYPFSLRPQAHEIIRTWAFYTIAKSHFHHQMLPWNDIAISGWGIAGKGMDKISKSRGGGPMPPLEMIDRYSADAVRYWAVSTGLGKDALISEQKIQLGSKLVTKLWNVARFSERFLVNYQPPQAAEIDHTILESIKLTPADRWILSRLQHLILQATQFLENYEYASAKSEIENYFWNDFADNYLEMCKQRLYTGESSQAQAAVFTLYSLLITICKLFAPFLPYITEFIYQAQFAPLVDLQPGEFASIHLSMWPKSNPYLLDASAEEVGNILLEIATSVRRYKSEHSLSLGTELQCLQIAISNPQLSEQITLASQDLSSITRARKIEVQSHLDPGVSLVIDEDNFQAGLFL